MRPGYTKSKKKLAKQKRKLRTKEIVHDDVEKVKSEDEEMKMDVDSNAEPMNRRQKKKKEVLAVKKEKLKKQLMQKSSMKARKQAARGVSGATSLVVNKVAVSHLQQAQKTVEKVAAASKNDGDGDTEMQM